MPTIAAGSENPFNKVTAEGEWDFEETWHSFVDWVSQTAVSINNETLEHPYLISLALLVLWAWPHILMLPVWFGKDAFRRMDTHARTTMSAMDRATAPVRGRRRDGFLSTYHSIVNASYERYESSRAPLFGGTPLSDGDFRIEEERRLPIALRIIRWAAFACAVFIFGRELYSLLSQY